MSAESLPGVLLRVLGGLREERPCQDGREVALPGMGAMIGPGCQKRLLNVLFSQGALQAAWK